MTKYVKSAGEMHQSDIEQGGDWYEERQQFEKYCKDAGIKCVVKPFDQYNGPYAELPDKSKLWFDGNNIVFESSKDRTTKQIKEKEIVPFLKKNYPPLPKLVSTKPGSETLRDPRYIKLDPQGKREFIKRRSIPEERKHLKLIKSALKKIIQSRKLKMPGAFDGLTRNKAESMMRKVLDFYTKGIFKDNHWQPVHKIIKDFADKGIYPLLEKSEYRHDNKGNPSGKEWLYVIPFEGNKGGWYLNIIASFGPSPVGSTDVYDLVYILQWDGRIKEATASINTVTAIVAQRYREEKNRKEWALVSKKVGKDGKRKVLYWFGVKKPSKEAVSKQEKRVHYFKHKK